MDRSVPQLPTFFECPISGTVIRSRDFSGVGFKRHSSGCYYVGYQLQGSGFLAVAEFYAPDQAEKACQKIKDKFKKLLNTNEEESNE